MTVPFSAGEIFEMAGQIERNGAKFYRRAAELAGDESTREMLLGLAEWEDSHERRFAELRNEFGGPDAAAPGDEAALYLRAMADRKVFLSDPAEALLGDEPMEDILNTAIGLEKDSIVFYQCMKDVVPPAAGKEGIDAIIKQEIGHVLDLTNQLEALKK